MFKLFSRASRPAGAVLIAAVVLTLFPAAAQAAPRAEQQAAQAQPHAEPDPRASQLLVKFAPGASAAQRAQARRDEGVEHVRSLPVPGLELVRVPDAVATDAHARDLAAHPRIQYAEPNHVQRSLAAAPDDTQFGDLWGLHNTGQTVGSVAGTPGIDLGALAAWEDFGRGDEDLIVAVMDEGVQLDHPDLRDNLWVNTGEVCGNGLDDDANGYADDCNGWDFFHNDNTVFDAADGDDHGTHVAGTIAATADNGQGVAGVAPGVKIMPIKWLGPGGGYVSDMIEALAYAKANGARITNGSYGGYSYSSSQRQAMIDSGLFHVVSAGNDGVNMDLDGAQRTYPCAYALANSVCVASISNRGAKAGSSNYGVNYVDVGAPGVMVMSAYPGSAYALKSGTSMAAPHVTGLAALLASVEPSITNTQLKTAITSTTQPLASLAGKVASGGMVRARAALVSATARPSRPLAPAAAAGEAAGSAQVSWTAPSHTGASALTGYTVWAQQGDAAPVSTAVPGAAATSAVVTGLQPGATYAFWVTAVNGSGEGVASEPVTQILTVATAPDAPAGLAATPGNTKLSLSWTAPADNGAAITGYTVSLHDGIATTTHAAAGTSTVVSGLTNGVPYTATVTATNSAGESAASQAVTATPAVTVPEAPADLAVTEGAGQLSVTWQAPADDGGSSILGYTAYLHDGATETAVALDEAARSHTFTGLAAGTAHTVSVTAGNALGEGTRATSPAATPYTVPTAPQQVAAAARDSALRVTWVAPASDGGRAVTGYTVTATCADCAEPVQVAAAAAARTADVTGLVNATTYTVTVTAANVAGSSPASAPVEGVPAPPPPPAPAPVSGGGGGGGGGGGAPAPVAPAPSPSPSPTASPTPEPDSHTTQEAEVTAPADSTEPVAVSVELPAGTVALRLEGVTSGGTVSVTQIAAPARPGFVTLPDGFDIDLGDVRAGQARLCVPVPVRAARAAGVLAAELRLWHVDADGSRQDITSEVTGGDVCGVATEFSPFVLGVARAARLSGPDRAATAAAVSAQRFAPGVPVAFVASADRFADALAAGPAAAKLGGPLLLTGADTLPAATSAELARLRPGRIVVVGGQAVIGQAVADALAAHGAVTRASGPDRFSTAAAVAETFGETGGTVFVATGADFPDALAGGAAAAAEGSPVLLAGRDQLPDATRAALARLAPARVVVLGGTAAVSDVVAAELGAAGATVTRLSGPDRFATAAAVAARFGGEVPVVYVATGEGFADALAGVPAASLHGAPLLLTGRDQLPAATAGELRRIGARRIVILGGAGAVSAAVADQLAAQLPG